MNIQNVTNKCTEEANVIQKKRYRFFSLVEFCFINNVKLK